MTDAEIDDTLNRVLGSLCCRINAAKSKAYNELQGPNLTDYSWPSRGKVAREYTMLSDLLSVISRL